MTTVTASVQLAGNLRSIAIGLEEGLANKPLKDKIEALSYELGTSVLTVAAICFHRDYERVFLQNLIAGFPTVTTIQELQVNTGTSAIEHAGKRDTFTRKIETFDQLGKLTEANHDTIINRCDIDGVQELAPVRILFADAEKLLKLDIVETNRLFNTAQLVIFSAPLDYRLTHENRAVMSMVLSKLDYLAVLAQQTESTEYDVEKVWHREPIPSHIKTVSASILSNNELPAFLTDVQSQKRLHVIQYFGLKKIQRFSQLLNTQISNKLHYLNCCEQADELSIMLLEKDSRAVSGMEKNKKLLSDLSDELEGLNRKLQEESRHSLVGKGAFYYLVESEMEPLKADHLEKELVHNTYKLTVCQDTLRDISFRLSAELKSRFEEDAHVVKESLRKLVTQYQGKLIDWPQGLATTQKAIESLTAVSASSEDHLEFKIRYKGEMPKRGFLKRIGEGRRSMFMVLMMFSIFGGMLGFNYRNYQFMSAFFIFLFIAGTIWTYFSWRKDDEFKMHSEIDKARDQLHSEYMRAVGEIERNKARVTNDFITNLIKLNRNEIDLWQKEKMDYLKKEREELKEKNQTKSGLLKDEIQAKVKLQSHLEQVLQKLDELEHVMGRSIEELGFT